MTRADPPCDGIENHDRYPGAFGILGEYFVAGAQVLNVDRPLGRVDWRLRVETDASEEPATAGLHERYGLTELLRVEYATGHYALQTLARHARAQLRGLHRQGDRLLGN